MATVDLTKKAESDTIILKKSGTYYVSETQTPAGHDSIGNFFFVVSISNNGNTNITLGAEDVPTFGTAKIEVM